MLNSASHKKKILLFLLVNLFLTGYAQNKIPISVVNKKCSRCSCTFFQNDSIIFKTLSDSLGYIIVPEHILDIYTKIGVRMDDEDKYYLRNNRQSPTNPLAFSETDSAPPIKVS